MSTSCSVAGSASWRCHWPGGASAAVERPPPKVDGWTQAGESRSFGPATSTSTSTVPRSST